MIEPTGDDKWRNSCLAFCDAEICPRALGRWALRTAAVQHNVPCITTLSGAAAAAEAIEALRTGGVEVVSLQELHAERVAVGE